MGKLLSEFAGTFMLVSAVCGAALFTAGSPGNGAGIIGVSLAVGMTVLAISVLVEQAWDGMVRRLSESAYRVGTLEKASRFADVQLDLSSDEPQGEMIEPEPAPGAIDTEHTAAPDAADALSSIPADVGAREALKQMIVQRDRQVMSAERDGIGAYELAVGVDQFVEALLEAARRA